MTAERIEVFSVGGEPSVDVVLSSGDVRVRNGDPGTVRLTVRASSEADLDALLLEQTGDTVTVRPRPDARLRSLGRLTVLIEAPTNVRFTARLASAGLSVDGEVGDLEVAVASGDVRAASVGRIVEVKSASGSVELGTVGGRLRVATASGDVSVDRARGAATISTASGRVRVAEADDALTLKSASGDLIIDRFSGDVLVCKSMSGSVDCCLPRGRDIEVDISTLSGRTTVPEPSAPAVAQSGERMRMVAKTVSGDIRVTGYSP